MSPIVKIQNLKKKITIDKDNNLVIFLNSKSSGQLYLTSNYFSGVNKYIININKLEIYEAEIYGDNEGIAGNIFKLKILLKAKNGLRIDEIDDSDKEKFEAKIMLPDNSTINCNKILFNNNENILIFENIITLAGESTFEIKYNNKKVKCNNCKVTILTGPCRADNNDNFDLSPLEFIIVLLFSFNSLLESLLI